MLGNSHCLPSLDAAHTLAKTGETRRGGGGGRSREHPRQHNNLRLSGDISRQHILLPVESMPPTTLTQVFFISLNHISAIFAFAPEDQGIVAGNNPYVVSDTRDCKQMVPL